MLFFVKGMFTAIEYIYVLFKVILYLLVGLITPI